MNIKSSASFAALAACGVAHAQQGWLFTYTDPEGVVASGSLSSVLQLNGTYLVTGGTLDITSDPGDPGNPGYPGGPLGNFDLLPASGLTADGLFLADNILYPAGGNPNGTSQVLDTDGLVFAGSGSSSSEEINIWGNGSSGYALYGAGPVGTYNPTDVDGTFNLQETSGPVSSSAVPGPVAALPMALGIIPLMRGRRKEK